MLRERDGPHREGEEPKPMMHGREKSDPAIVAVKPTNKANEPTVEASAEANAAEPLERRAGTTGNADQQSTCRAQNQARVSHALERIRQPVPSHTRGGSRVRESRTHGSGRGGACDETHVPTATDFASPAQVWDCHFFHISPCDGMSVAGRSWHKASAHESNS
jgi:hypothetical protein